MITHTKRTVGPIETVSRSDDIQVINYKIVAETSQGVKQLERFFMGGDSNWEVNSSPSMVLEFSDKDLILSHPYTGLIPPTESFWIAVSASTRSDGTAYSRVGEGLVEKYKRTLAPSGVRKIALSVFSQPELRHSYVSPNQTAVGECEMGALFSGSYTAEDGTTWSPDAKGNYPNGLLYDTGLTYVGDSDIFPGVADVPIQTSYGSQKKIQFINQVLGEYGMDYIINPTYGTFRIRNKPSIEAYPLPTSAANFVTMSLGENLSEYTDEIDLTDFGSCVTVVGQDETIFYRCGDGKKEIFSVDEDLLSYDSSMRKSYIHLSASLFPVQNIKIKTSPNVKSILGYSAFIDDTPIGLITRSVVGVRQVMNTDHWYSEFSFEKPAFEEGKTIAQIKEELDKTKEDEMRGISYLRAVSGYSDYKANNWTMRNICAIGFGRGSDSSSRFYTSSGMIDPLIIKDINGVLGNSMTTRTFNSAFATLQYSEANALIREMVLFGNAETENRPHESSFTITWSRPGVEWNADLDSNPVLSVSYCPKNYLIGVDSITLSSRLPGCVPFAFKATDASAIRVLSNSGDGFLPVHPTSTVGGGSTSPLIITEHSLLMNSADKAIISNNLKRTTDNFDLVTLTNRIELLDSEGEKTGIITSSREAVQVFFEFNVPMNYPEKTFEFMKRVSFMANAFGRYSATNVDDPENPYVVSGNAVVTGYFYAPRTVGLSWVGTWLDMVVFLDDETVWRDFNVTAGNTYGSIEYLMKNENLVDENGIIRVALVCEAPGQYPDATVSIFLEHAALVADMIYQESSEEPIEDTHFEKCSIDTNGRIITRYTPSDVYSIYAYANFVNGRGFVEDETQLNLLSVAGQYDDPLEIWSPAWKEMVKKYTHRRSGLDRIARDAKQLLRLDYKDAEDEESYAIYRDIVSHGYVFVEYQTSRIEPNIPLPSPLDVSMFSISYTPNMDGSRSDFYMNMDSAPPYGVDIHINYRCVNGGAIGKTLLAHSTTSAVREGFDKTLRKTCNVQYDLYPLHENIGSVDSVGENPVQLYGSVSYSTVSWLQTYLSYIRGHETVDYDGIIPI
jgi:hypothetical protein